MRNPLNDFFNVGHTVCVDHIYGHLTLPISKEHAEMFSTDPESAIRWLFGVTSGEYLEWLAERGLTRCAYIKKNGKQCGNYANKDPHEDLKAWLRAQGTMYCYCHGEGV